jgi:hypothetical protein
LRENEKGANIHVRSGAIWGIPFVSLLVVLPTSRSWGETMDAEKKRGF